MTAKDLCLALVVIILAMGTLSCGKVDPPATVTENSPENMLRIDIPFPIGSLYPCDDTISGSTLIFPLLYSHLFVPNDEGQLEPDLATRWAYDPASFTWSIDLRNDALFHDGRPITSSDVKFSLLHYLGTQFPSVFDSIAKLDCPTDTSLRINLHRDDPDFPRKIWDTSIVPDLPSSVIDYHNKPIGSGPFAFSYRDGDREVGLTAYERFYGGRPPLDGIVFYYQPDGEDSWARLVSGKTDIVHRLYPKDYQIINKYNDRFYFDARASEYYTILLFNTNDPLLADRDVRLALSYAVDKRLIIDEIFHGAATAAIGPAGVNTPYRNPDLKPVPYSPRKALDLLRHSGWAYNPEDCLLYKGGRSFELTILVFEGNQVDRTVAEYLQYFLNDVGIKTHLQPLPQDELLRRYVRHNEFQAALTEFRAASTTPEIMQQLWAPMNGQIAAAGMFDDPHVTSLFSQVVQVGDSSEAKMLLGEIDALIASLQPGMFLFHKTALDAMSDRVLFPFHFSFDQSGIHRLRHASLTRHR